MYKKNQYREIKNCRTDPFCIARKHPHVMTRLRPNSIPEGHKIQT